MYQMTAKSNAYGVCQANIKKILYIYVFQQHYILEIERYIKNNAQIR